MSQITLEVTLKIDSSKNLHQGFRPGKNEKSKFLRPGSLSQVVSDTDPDLKKDA